MSDRRPLLALLLASVLAGAGARAAARTPQDRFDHLRHQRLFPTCDGCHRVEADRVTSPGPATCGECHDGETARGVDWTPGPRRATNLDFNHADVFQAIRATRDTTLACRACHVPQGGTRMDVRRAVVESCLDCHAPGRDHFTEATCTECHVPIARAPRFTVSQIRGLPEPRDHAEPDFLLAHGAAARTDVARCETCHARELCSSCHVDAESVESIQAMASDPRVAEAVAGRAPGYPTPASHRDLRWLETHGAAAANPAQCATCHTRTSCRTCHADDAPPAVEALPPAPARPAQERGPGVALERRAPASHTPTFLENHRSVAASATAQCQACHARTQCTGCHTASEALVRPGDRGGARYHPANFLQQHSAAAFGAQSECATCHNLAAFCRSCHLDQGFRTQNRFDTGFHNRKPNWIFGHGQAARQGLETCATCHAQRDCLSCHSAVGGRRINPHGPDFDPERVGSKTPGLCLTCHFPGILDR